MHSNRMRTTRLLTVSREGGSAYTDSANVHTGPRQGPGPSVGYCDCPLPVLVPCSMNESLVSRCINSNGVKHCTETGPGMGLR